MASTDKNQSGYQLHAEDAAALDAIIEAQAWTPRLAADTQSVAVDPSRLERVSDVLMVIGSAPVGEPSDDLVRRTLHRVVTVRSVDLDVARMQPLRGPAVPVRLSEIVAVAAMVIIAVSLALPVLVRTQQEARRVACESNLGAAGHAMALYGADHLSAMPRGNIELNSDWYRIGMTRAAFEPVKSNSANLYLLARHHYIDPHALACPENPHAPRGLSDKDFDWPSPEAVSYSYQNQFANRVTRLVRVPRMAVLADKNPRFAIMPDGTKLMFLRSVPDTSASLTHRLRGQNVLFGDGSVWWSVHPLMPNGDNIWLIQGVEDYQGNETPQRYDDAFLVP